MRVRAFVFVLAAAITVLAVPAWARQGAGATDALYQDARRLFESLDYENAVKSLDQLIAALLAAPPTDAAGRDRLASAYEMRARSKFGLGNPDEARADFVSLLRVNPNYTLTGQVSPRVVTLFDETAAQTVTNLALSITPAGARVLVDEVPIDTTAPARVTAGDHVISAEQRGYRSAKQSFSAKAGETAVVNLTLERVSAVIYILTSPADVDVTLDGVKLGKTPAGPPPPEMADALARSGVPVASVSGPIIVSDVVPGPHTLDLTRDCLVRVTNKIAVDTPDDYTVGPVIMQPAVATLTVQANEPKAQVFIDGAERGGVPFTMTDLCEGPHVIELRSRFGRDSRRVEARAGEAISFDGVLKPAFAVVSASGEAANLDLDARLSIERALGAAQTVRLLAPPAEQTDKLLKSNQLPASWLASDAEGKPAGAALQMSRPVRERRLHQALRRAGHAGRRVGDGARSDADDPVAARVGQRDAGHDRTAARPPGHDRRSRGKARSRAGAHRGRRSGCSRSTSLTSPGRWSSSIDANGPANGRVQVGDSHRLDRWPAGDRRRRAGDARRRAPAGQADGGRAQGFARARRRKRSSTWSSRRG